MYFRIIGNRGQESFVKTKSKAEGEDAHKRLSHVQKMGKIKSFTNISFKAVVPDDMMKVAIDAQE